MFSSATIPQENRQINPDCGFQGQRMFVWIPPTGQTVAGVCACMYIYVCVVYVAVCAEEKGYRGKRGRESGVLFSAVLRAWGLSFTVCSCHNKQTMWKNCNSEWKATFFQHATTTGDDYMMQKKSQETVHLCQSCIFSKHCFLNAVELL